MWQIKLFGIPEIRHHGEPVELACSSKARALFYYLAAEQRPLNRRELAVFLWDEFNPTTAQNNLRNALFHLRKDVCGCLETNSRQVVFHLSENVDLDIRTFMNVRTDSSVEDITAAVACYQGMFLAGFSVEGAPRFNTWLLDKRELFERSALGYMLQLAIYHDRQGLVKEGLEFTRRMLEINPFHEGAIYYRLLFLNRLGLRHLASQEYNDYRQSLSKYSVAAPAESLKSLLEQPAEIPAQQSPQSLPRRTSPFFGRSTEMDTLAKRILALESPFINLTGSTGIGKTRLAIEIGERLKDRLANGVVYANLKGNINWQGEYIPDEIARQIFLVMGLPFTTANSIMSQLIETLRVFEGLLILDNLTATPQSTAFLDQLVNSTEHVRLLVTSPEPIRLDGGIVLQLTGLDYPAPGEEPLQFDPLLIKHYSSLALFEERASRSLPSFSITRENWKAVVRICQFFQGMPLGIEICASQVYTRSPLQIAEMLESGFQRAAEESNPDPFMEKLLAIGASEWASVSDWLQRILPALSLFRGGFSKEAFSAVTGEHDSMLHVLKDKNIVQSIFPYYYSVRSFILAYLSRRNETLSKQNLELYCRYYLELIINLDFSIAAETGNLLSQHARDQDNITHAWQIALELGEYELIKRASNPFASYLKRLGRVDRLYDILGQTRQTLKSLPDQDPLVECTRAGIVLEISHLEELRGNLQQAHQFSDEVIRLAQPHGDHDLLAGAYLFKAAIDYVQQNLDECIRNTNRGLELAIRAGNRRLIATAFIGLGMAHNAAHRYQEALAIYKTGLKDACIPQNSRMMQTLLMDMAICYLYQGKMQEAREYNLKALQICEDIWDMTGRALINFTMGQIYKASGQLDQAESTFIEDLATQDTLGQWRWKSETLANLAVIKLWKGQSREAYRLIKEAEDISREKDLPNLAAIQILKGRILLALRRITDAELNKNQAAEFIEIKPQDGTTSLHLKALEIDLLMVAGREQEACALALEVLPSIHKIDYNFPEDPFTVYLSLYQALKTARHSSVGKLHENVQSELEQLAAQADSDQQEQELFNVPARRLMKEYITSMRGEQQTSRSAEKNVSFYNITDASDS